MSETKQDPCKCWNSSADATNNTLAVMVLPVAEDNSKHTHHRGDEKTMRTLEMSKQTNVPGCKYPVVAILRLSGQRRN